MKSLMKIALVIGLIAFAYSSSFATYSRITMNGGTNGYYSTSYQKDDNGNISILCTDPGNSSCPFSAAGQPTIYNTLAAYAAQQIAGGTLSGSHSQSSGGVNYTVTWSATDLKNATISINP